MTIQEAINFFEREIAFCSAAPGINGCEMQEEWKKTIAACTLAVEALKKAEVIEWRDTYSLPTTMWPETLRDAIETYGKKAQVDVAVEEMSELIKALLKNRRAENSPDTQQVLQSRLNISEEIADVAIMLTQLLMIFNCRDAVQRTINEKTRRLALRLLQTSKACTGGLEGKQY